jgi:hypothetical protein
MESAQDFRPKEVDMPQPRYRAPQVPGGATREALAWLGAEKQREIVIAWIKQNYERRRPDHLFFDEQDSWDPFEEVRDEFDGAIPEHIVEAAIDAAGSQGEWVRRNTTRRSEIEHYDLDRLTELFDHVRAAKASRLGTARELQERVALNAAVQSLSAKIDEIQAHLGMHGNNGGPPDLDSATGQFAAVRDGVAKLTDIMQKKSPDLASATQTAFSIETVAKENGWLKAEIDEGRRAYIKAFCETSGKDHAHALTALLGAFVLLVYGMLLQFVAWLEVVAP